MSGDELDLDAIDAAYRPSLDPATFHAGDGRVVALVAEVRRLREAADAEVLLSHQVVDWAAEAIEQAQVRGRVRVAHRLGVQGRRSAARAVLDVARAALNATEQ